jgi:glycosyltransferase involved in cell wall biosynthesis
MNEFHPLVSIVMPIYNGSNYMRSAIDSALEQDYDNLEVIVVNDGSTDNTDEIAKNYGNKIKYFSKENGGVSTALNLAIQNAKGDYISWLSHDDYYLPNKISRQIEELSKIEEREMIILYSNSEILDLSRETKSYFLKLKRIPSVTKIESLKALYVGRIHGCSLLIPKQAFITVGYFNPKLITTQDYHLWFEFINAGYLFYYIPEVLMATRHHNEQGTITKADIVKSENLELWRFADELFSTDIKNASKKDRSILIHPKKPSLFSKIKVFIKKALKKLLPNSTVKRLRWFYSGFKNSLDSFKNPKDAKMTTIWKKRMQEK